MEGPAAQPALSGRDRILAAARRLDAYNAQAPGSSPDLSSHRVHECTLPDTELISIIPASCRPQISYDPRSKVPRKSRQLTVNKLIVAHMRVQGTKWPPKQQLTHLAEDSTWRACIGSALAQESALYAKSASRAGYVNAVARIKASDWQPAKAGKVSTLSNSEQTQEEGEKPQPQPHSQSVTPAAADLATPTPTNTADLQTATEALQPTTSAEADLPVPKAASRVDEAAISSIPDSPDILDIQPTTERLFDIAQRHRLPQDTTHVQRVDIGAAAEQSADQQAAVKSAGHSEDHLYAAHDSPRGETAVRQTDMNKSPDEENMSRLRSQSPSDSHSLRQHALTHNDEQVAVEHSTGQQTKLNSTDGENNAGTLNPRLLEAGEPSRIASQAEGSVSVEPPVDTMTSKAPASPPGPPQIAHSSGALSPVTADSSLKQLATTSSPAAQSAADRPTDRAAANADVAGNGVQHVDTSDYTSAEHSDRQPGKRIAFAAVGAAGYASHGMSTLSPDTSKPPSIHESPPAQASNAVSPQGLNPDASWQAPSLDDLPGVVPAVVATRVGNGDESSEPPAKRPRSSQADNIGLTDHVPK